MNKPVRWTFVRKVELLNEIRAGLLSPAEACVQFDIEPEELSRWQELFLLGGETALMAGQAQKYRQRPAHNNSKASSNAWHLRLTCNDPIEIRK